MEELIKKNPMNDVMKDLEEGVANLFDSENYKNYLNVMSKFYNYSFNNNLLIAMQRPDATHIASYTSCKKRRKGDQYYCTGDYKGTC